jgi:hypothetical protein
MILSVKPCSSQEVDWVHQHLPDGRFCGDGRKEEKEEGAERVVLQLRLT